MVAARHIPRGDTDVVTLLLPEAPNIPPNDWDLLWVVDWEANPLRAAYGFAAAIDKLQRLENRPLTACELFGTERRYYRNGPEKMNEILRKADVPYRLKRIQRTPNEHLDCEAGERLFAFAPV